MTMQEKLKKVVAWLISSGYATSQRDLAEKMGYRESSFSQILNGHVPISDKFLGEKYRLAYRHRMDKDRLW